MVEAVLAGLRQAEKDHGIESQVIVCGIRNILTKVHGSSNPINLVKATIQGLLQLRTREEVEKLRGVTL